MNGRIPRIYPGECQLEDIHGLSSREATIRKKWYLKSRIDDCVETISFSMSRGGQTEMYIDVHAKTRKKAILISDEVMGISVIDVVEESAADLKADYRIQYTVPH